VVTVILALLLVLQGMAVHWRPAQITFATVDLCLNDWAWSLVIASSVLSLDDVCKLGAKMVNRRCCAN